MLTVQTLHAAPAFVPPLFKNTVSHQGRENPLSHLHEDEAPVQTDKLTR